MPRESVDGEPPRSGGGARSALLVAAWGVGGAVASGALYALVSRMVALVYARAFLVILGGGAAGSLVALGAKAAGEARRSVLLAGGTLAGLLGLYVHWVAWILIMSDGRVFAWGRSRSPGRWGPSPRPRLSSSPGGRSR